MKNSFAMKHFVAMPVHRKAVPFFSGLFTSWMCLLLLIQPMQAGLIVSPQSSIPADLDEGQFLLDELNCIACHARQDSNGSKSSPRTSPNLQTIGSRVSGQFLRAYLNQPASEKPGTTMPDLMHSLDAKERTDAVDELVHFLASLHDGAQVQAAGSNPFKMTQGRSLYHQVGCVACHAPQETANPSQWLTNSVPLGPLAKKYTVNQLTEFLLDPLKNRPAGRMPSLSLSQAEASSIAMYLLRDQTNAPPDKTPSLIGGLAYDYFEASVNRTDQLESLKPTETGSLDQFNLAPKRRNESIGFRFTGLVQLPSDGTYNFYTASDDGTKLFIGDQLVVNNDGEHATTEKKGSLALSAGLHPIMLLWFNAGGPAELKVSYEGPGLKKQPIPPSALFFAGRAMNPLDQETVHVDAAKAERGRMRFGALGCAFCHQTGLNDPSGASSKAFKSLAQLDPNNDQGCLSTAPARGVPKFDFTDRQRLALKKALSNPSQWAARLTPKQKVSKAMAALNCYACHSREGNGGPDPSRAQYFTTVGQEDLGDEGRLPPHLTGVGAKLRPEWLRSVLMNHGSVRPYMATRMPQFGKTNALPLIEALLEADGSALSPSTGTILDADIKYGRALVGSGGLSCISCHTFGSYKSLGVPAMDLTQMTRRLTPSWFHRYLLDPPSLRPGTRMPPFWPDGKSLRQDVLLGDTTRQINAIWAYLSKSSEAGIPPGLIQGKVELVASQEALIYRAFIQQSGTRGIGVAFPEKANFIFDANELRPTLIWQGPFMDASRHRSGRGEGAEGPLGYNVIQCPEGPPLAVLASPADAWPTQTGKKAGYKMLGYQLDSKRRPTFKYTFNQVQVIETTIAVPGDLESSLRRTLTFTMTGDKPVTNLWLRAWTGTSIAAKPDGSFLADGKVELKFDMGASEKPILRQSGGATELIVPVAFDHAQATVVEDILW